MLPEMLRQGLEKTSREFERLFCLEKRFLSLNRAASLGPVSHREAVVPKICIDEAFINGVVDDLFGSY